ncbi:regulatory iron-sulfur-containing complex subunit RicT [Emticicia sp. 21SJ11W-3]|uniref:PSP1 domain-containing protein n=1 Tax=Emticicia sp. 21SJ11W-3 TaxID=2916755 RepID=UPI00209D8D60|nr:regulatory iron-sulfur-containing complex subunit RicT [Emticicia sp. 21SJ11W-3]UTA67320.1 Signal peptidase-like protein [Emticicia sp. 21SJ11W-3]
MGCGQCSSGGCGAVKALDRTEKSNHKTVAGCSSGGCSTGGCNKMNAYDWLSNMEVPTSMRYNVVEIKFKGGRKEYFRNTNNLELYTGDFVICEMPTGYHIGSVSLQGELVRLQMIKKGIQDDENIRKILRIAQDKDIEKHQQAIARDLPTMYRVREIAKDLKLGMKVSDVEFQSDNTKATFYYSADDRVDFRELIKLLAAEFKIRVEMKQISLRQEAARVGGIGSCGRELCCSTWLTDFRAIPTSAARYQNLSLNPAKLSGQCGRLKCCLNYELETYLDALSDIPTVEKPLKTEKGIAVLQKTDIFRRIMWFSYNNDINWHSLPIHKVVEIMKMNEQGLVPSSLEDLNLLDTTVSDRNAPRNSDLDRLDRKYTDKGKKPHHSSSKEQKNEVRPQGNNQKTGNQPPAQKQGNQPQQPKQGGQPGNQNKPQNNQGNKGAQQPNQKGNQPNQGGNPNKQQQPGNQGANQTKPQNNQGNQVANQPKQQNQPNKQQPATPNAGGNPSKQGGNPPKQPNQPNNQGANANSPAKQQNNQGGNKNQQRNQPKNNSQPNGNKNNNNPNQPG